MLCTTVIKKMEYIIHNTLMSHVLTTLGICILSIIDENNSNFFSPKQTYHYSIQLSICALGLFRFGHCY